MAELQKIKPRWTDEPCLVAAPGPSLTPDVVRHVRMARWFYGWNVIAVNDAYRELPYADVLYACDNSWWDINQKCRGFTGEKWACHEQDPNPGQLHGNDKRAQAEAYGINLVRGMDGDEFSVDPAVVRYGHNSGFQAINLALLFGCKRIVLVGFDMRHVDGKSHFFGDHPKELRTAKDSDYRDFAPRFERAAKKLPKDISIVNATPGSALKCFPMGNLEDELGLPRRDRGVPCNGTELQSAAG